MVNNCDRDRCGLGLTIDNVVDRSVAGINRTTTKNNKSIIVMAFDETQS